MKQNIRERNLWILFFVAPGLIIVITFIILPLLLSLVNSLYLWRSTTRIDFAGLENFRRIFFQFPYQDRFFNAIRNNLRWFVVTMLVQNILGLLFGYFLSRNIAGSKVLQRIFFIPVLFSIVAVGFLWRLYLNPNHGLINQFLRVVGMGALARPWLGEAAIATYVIIGVNIWRWLGFPTLVFFAAINNVPQDCIEASYLDGAKESTIFFRVIVPLIVPAISIITVLTMIGSLNVFEQVYTMAGVTGGPFYSTDTLGTLFYRTAFGGVDTGMPEIGVGSAIAVIIYFLTFISSLLVIIGLKNRETAV
jgi:raffinose/stachyose/melibiose transport system permease protein